LVGWLDNANFSSISAGSLREQYQDYLVFIIYISKTRYMPYSKYLLLQFVYCYSNDCL